jgi:hypothetical protein
MDTAYCTVINREFGSIIREKALFLKRGGARRNFLQTP